MLSRRFSALVVALTLVAASETEAATEKSKLDRLVRTYWEYHLADRPRTATYIGDSRHDDKLFDPSVAAYRRRFAAARDFLNRADAIRAEQLVDSDRVTLEILRGRLALALEGEPLHSYLEENYLLPMNQIEGPHHTLLTLPNEHPFRSARDYRNYIKRLQAFPAVADGVIGAMRAGVVAGVVHPRAVVELLLPQLQTSAVQESPLYAPLRRFPANVSPAERKKLITATERAIERSVHPAFARLLAFTRDEYLPKARTTFALSDLPRGRELYAYTIKVRTTTDLTAERVHALALEELERVEAERARVVRSLGFEGTTREFNQQLQTNRELRLFDAASVEQEIRRNLGVIEARLPELFADLPPFRYELKQVEPYRAASFPFGAFFPGSADNKRPGIYYYNTHNIETEGVRKFMLPTLSFHEAAPGHMLQSVYGNANRTLPAFRRHSGNAAFNEGWAVYAERLADEVGAYPDAYSRNFYLSSTVSSWTSAVGETGLHAKGWSSEQAYTFIRRYLPVTPERFASMVARWSVLPAQTLGYGIGSLTIAKLRLKAEEELGATFDIREFHKFVLQGGALPMNLLTKEVDRWIAEQKR